MSCIDITTIEVESIIGSSLNIEQCNSTTIEIVTLETPQLEISHCVSLLPAEAIEIIDSRINNDLIAGTGITFNYNLPQITISLNKETVEDTVGQLLKAGNYINLDYIDGSGLLTISTSGLQPSGNYSVVGHIHTSSDITNFNSAVNNLLPSISGSQYIDIQSNNNIYTISTSGLQPSGNYSLIGHSHASSDIEDFNTSVSGLIAVKNLAAGSGIGISSNNGIFNISTTGTFGLTSEEVDDRVSQLLTAGTGILLNYNDSTGLLIIATTGLQPSGNYSLIGHTHIASNITDFNSSVSGLLPVTDITGIGYTNVSNSNGIYTVSVSGLQPSGNYALTNHTHTTSNITDFNSGVSGLLTVKNLIAGSGIGISSSSGIFNISTTGTFGLTAEEVDDRVGQLLVAGTGVQLIYNDSANTLTLNNLHTEINELSLEPQGFVNRLHSILSFNDSTRTFTIAPSGSSYEIYIEGVKVTKTASESIVIGSGTALNYLHFNTDTGLLDNKTTQFNFDTDVPIAFIHWNSDINQSTFFGEERHGIRMDSMTHKWIHNTFGMQYINGLSIGNYVLLGNGSSNSHAQVSISDGTLYQEDIIINIADGNNGIEFTQQLSPIAYIPVYYHSGTTGQWVRDVSTPYPLKYNATRALYNLYSGGTWTTPNVPNNRYFAMWIVATNDINDPVLAIMGQREDSSLGSAENNNNWGEINLTNIPTNEIRPLYRLIFVTNHTFANTPKSSLQSILDLRKSIITSTYGVSQNDHGSLFGLGDDDHSQYVHINEARTISANHTFTNGLTINNGLLSATSGNFTALQVNGTGVSVSGHTHTSSNITDFNSSVSGLLPVKNVIGSGYIGVSSSSGDYTVFATGLQPSGNYANTSHTHILNDITNINGNRGDISVSNSGLNWLLNNGVVNTQHLNNEIIIDCGLILSSSSDFMYSKDKVYNWHE